MEQPPAPPPPAESQLTEVAAPAKNQQLSKVGWAGLTVIMALTFYFMFTYTGPFKWMAELQLNWIGSYSEKLTFVFTMFLLLIPAAVIWKLVESAIKKLGPGIAPPPAQSPAVAPGTVAAPVKTEFGFGGFLLFVGAIALGIGIFMYWRGATAGELTAVAAKDLEEGRKPASSYLSIEGTALWKEMISFKKTSTDHYVAVISPAWKPGEVAVYLECRDNDIPPVPQMGAATYTGLTAVGGLPGPVRVEFEKGLLRPKDGYVVLVLKDDPQRLKDFGKWPLLIGAGLLVVGVVWWLIKRSMAKT